MSSVHWLGTGLSSIPGLRRLLKKNYNVFVWNRTIQKAQTLFGDLTSNIYKFDFSELDMPALPVPTSGGPPGPPPPALCGVGLW